MALVDSSSVASTSGKSHHSRRFSGVFSSFFDAFRCYVPQSGGGKLIRTTSKKQQRREISKNFVSEEEGIDDESSRAAIAAAIDSSSEIRPRRLNLKQIIQKDEEDEAIEKQRIVKSTIKRDLKAIVSQLHNGDGQEKAAAQIRKLSRDSAENREHFADLGAIPLLVRMLDSSQSAALLALLNLAIGNNKNKAAIVACGAVPKIVSILNSGGGSSTTKGEEADVVITSAHESATAAFLSLSALDSNKPIIGTSGAILPLLRILELGSPQSRKDAIRVLYNLSICSTNATNFANANAIPLLLGLITTDDFADKALAILGNVVATSDQGRRSLMESGVSKLLAALNFYMENAASMVDSGSASACSNSSSEESSLGSNSSGSSSSSSKTVDSSACRCLERLLYVLMVMSHHNGAARQAMLRGGAVSPLLEVALLGSAIAQRRASRILECLREDRMQGRPVSAPMAVVGLASGPSSSVKQPVPARASQTQQMPKRVNAGRSNLSSGNLDLRPSSSREANRDRGLGLVVVSEERKAVNWMVKKSLERNMEKMVRRARMPSTDMAKVKTFGMSTSSRSLLD